MKKLTMPKLSKPHLAPHAPRLPRRPGSAAFGAGGGQAFGPATMQAPDQAFGAAMALPQGEVAPLAEG